MATRAELRSLFKSLIDDKNGQIFDDTRINELLFEGAQNVQDLIESLDENYFTGLDTITVPQASTTVSLQESTRQVLRVTRMDSDPPQNFESINIREIAPHREKYGENNDYRPAYALRGQSLIYPTPFTTDHQIEIEYTLQLVNLTEDTQSWSDLPPAGERLIAYEAAVIGLVAEDSDASQMKMLRDEMRARLITNVDQRDRRPRTVNYISEDEY